MLPLKYFLFVVVSSVVYAHIQATGMVNNHLVTCFRHTEVGELIKNKAANLDLT